MSDASRLLCSLSVHKKLLTGQNSRETMLLASWSSPSCLWDIRFCLLQSGSQGTLSCGERTRTEDRARGGIRIENRASEGKGGRCTERRTRVSRLISEPPFQLMKRMDVSVVNVCICALAGVPAPLPSAGANFQQLYALFEEETQRGMCARHPCLFVIVKGHI